MDAHSHGRIFVSIASYRDNQCQYTIKDLFEKAKHPERVVVGVCFQVAKEDTDSFLLDLSPWTDHIRTYFMHHTEAKGPCYARALIQQKLFRDEDYYFQIDSHFRFAQDWDVICLDQLSKCQSSRPILTAYASSYTLPKDYEPGGPDAAVLATSRCVTILCADTFGDQNKDDPFLRIKTRNSRSNFNDVPPPSLFWTARFAFSKGDVVREVPYDEKWEYIFFGEEIAMSARLWTSGWDLFNPTKVIAYHLGSRAHRHWFRQVQTSEEQLQHELIAKQRICGLLGTRWPNGQTYPPPEPPYGLGLSRSLAEYEAFVGICFSDCTFRGDRAKNGGLSADLFPPQWAEEEREKIMHASQMQDVASWAGKDNVGAREQQIARSLSTEGPHSPGAPQKLNPEAERARDLARMRIHSLQAQFHCGGGAHEVEVELCKAFVSLSQLEASLGNSKEAWDASSKALEHADAVGSLHCSFSRATVLCSKAIALMGLQKYGEAKNILKETVLVTSEALSERCDDFAQQLVLDVLESIHNAHEKTDDRKGLEDFTHRLHIFLRTLRKALGPEPVGAMPLIGANEKPPDIGGVESMQVRIMERIALMCIATGRDKDLDIVRRIFKEFRIARESPGLRRLLAMLQSSGSFLDGIG